MLAGGSGRRGAAACPLLSRSGQRHSSRGFGTGCSAPGMPAGAEPMSQQTFTTVALELAIGNPQH